MSPLVNGSRPVDFGHALEARKSTLLKMDFATLSVSRDVDLFVSVGMEDVARVSTLAKMDLGNACGGVCFDESVSLSGGISTLAKTAGTDHFGVDACKLGIFSVSVDLDWLVKGIAVFG